MSSKTDSAKTSVYKPRPISGFLEWLPEVRLVELRWMDDIRAAFESYGFCSIETPSVEEIEVLAAKGGDADKEIYGLRRLAAEPGEEEGGRLALHYDLTVPMARYVAQHFGDLVFPFKRYQMQRCWRGERPQEGRLREFYQCDIDVIDMDEVSLHFDAEIPEMTLDVLSRLGVGPVCLHINNRKILQGFYQGLGIEDIVGAIRIADKLDKIGHDGVIEGLTGELGLAQSVAKKCVELASIQTLDASFADEVRAFGIENEQLEAGLEELTFVMLELAHLPEGSVMADMSIARGFDYYTGTVYEGKLVDYPDFPTVCAGGRYDNLVGSYSRQKLPGVGISIGFSRIFSKLVKEGRIEIGAKCPTDVMVACLPGSSRTDLAVTSRKLRERGFKVEMYHEAKSLKAQMKYASRKGIPYVWFPANAEQPNHEIKDMITGEQAVADIETWKP
ncbi:histidine--tRNA ligase [Magnetovibrio blakemorei]|uniref:Histidine--tRNA ligase n=1 Tax=Magnetovibrio blakemorei TaxID=28181 RepID=A0A1E5Q5Q3_9PROT|nr:histidine--tRNA ligase [Magnetovibrio blakemorei]OEJ65229.1 histidine--tRNA ligase [Magnetovibrio blakemorei]